MRKRTTDTYGRVALEHRVDGSLFGTSFLVIRDADVIHWIQSEAERTGKFESAIVRRCFETGASIEMRRSSGI